ncbi:MAG: hypothetical protein JJ863_24100 [Deltaproteobacteria bacterium]|nr:hypothetical protein [Deltaproteobacteria bacterium]
MRALVPFALVLAFASGVAHAQSDDLPPEERWRLELVLSGERHYVRMIAETPEGGEDEVASRLWTGGFDLCPMDVIRRWVHIGGCLGLHLVPGNDAEYGVAYEDQTLAYLARMQLRATFFAPGRYLRGGLDLHYRSYLRVQGGRESGLEAGFRLGVEFLLGEQNTPLMIGLSFRAPLFATRSDSTYSWPISAGGMEVGSDTRPTRNVRFYVLGLVVGSVFSFR